MCLHQGQLIHGVLRAAVRAMKTSLLKRAGDGYRILTGRFIVPGGCVSKRAQVRMYVCVRVCVCACARVRVASTP